MGGTLALSKAELRRLLHNKRYFIFTVAFPVVIYLLVGKQVKSVGAGYGVDLSAYYMVAMATYSPSMNIIYGVEPYSTMKPATSSDSASTRSNGGRLVSASAEMKKTTNIGKSGSQNQFNIVNHDGNPSQTPRPCAFCASTIALKLSEPTHSKTVMKTNPIETS